MLLLGLAALGMFLFEPYQVVVWWFLFTRAQVSAIAEPAGFTGAGLHGSFRFVPTGITWYKDAPLRNHEAIQIYAAPTATVESLERRSLSFQVKLVVLRVLQRLQRLLEFRGDGFILPQNHL